MLSKAIQAVREFNTIAGVAMQKRPSLEFLSLAFDDDLRVRHFSKTVHAFAELMRRQKTERCLRIGLLAEEFAEYLEAEAANDLVGIADAQADMTYINFGNALVYGIPLAEVFNAVQKSNMEKFPGGVVTMRDDGKILKPEGWQLK